MNIKTGDNVRVLSGKDKGKTGKVTQVLPKLGMVVVDGINTTVRHMKARGKQAGQKINYNGPLRASKVTLVTDK